MACMHLNLKVPYLQSTMTTMMTMMMMVTTRTKTITPAMTATLLLSVGNCVVVPSVVGIAEDGTDVVSSIVVVLEDVTGVVSPGLNVCDIAVIIMGLVGVGRAPCDTQY